MPRDRFKLIKSCFRTDDKAKRDKNDILSPVRDVLLDFQNRISNAIYPPTHCTVDEQLLAFRGGFGARQYMPNKPGKFGIKKFWLTNSQGTYALSCIPYINRNTFPDSVKAKYGGVTEAIVMELAKELYDSGSNITGDNFFSSAKLTALLADKKISYVGTMRRNRVDVPPAAKSISGRQKGDSRFFYSDGVKLCSFWDRGRKPVILIDSFASSGGHVVDGKPDTVEFYNNTKAGVDLLDKKISMFSMRRTTRRWPFVFVMNLFDVCIINGMYLYEQRNPVSAKNTFHFRFMKEVALSLVRPLLEERIKTPIRSRDVRMAFNYLGYEATFPQIVSPQSSSTPDRDRCSFCNERKVSRVRCFKCSKFVCSEHRSWLCVGCCSDV